MKLKPTVYESAAIILQPFLAAAQRPEDTLNYQELLGFLFGVACSPEMIQPVDWLPEVFNGQDAAYADLAEAGQVMQAMMTLYNQINQEILRGYPLLPADCQPAADAMANLEAGAPLSLWSRGFLVAHEWLTDVWEANTPEDLDEELGACVLALSFFVSPEMAEGYWREFEPEGMSLEEMARQILEEIPAAMVVYSDIGRNLFEEPPGTRLIHPTPVSVN